MGGAKTCDPTPFDILLSTFEVTFVDKCFDIPGFPVDFELYVKM
jgi:hypothetical protein